MLLPGPCQVEGKECSSHFLMHFPDALVKEERRESNECNTAEPLATSANGDTRHWHVTDLSYSIRSPSRLPCSARSVGRGAASPGKSPFWLSLRSAALCNTAACMHRTCSSQSDPRMRRQPERSQRQTRRRIKCVWLHRLHVWAPYSSGISCFAMLIYVAAMSRHLKWGWDSFVLSTVQHITNRYSYNQDKRMIFSIALTHVFLRKVWYKIRALLRTPVRILTPLDTRRIS